MPESGGLLQEGNAKSFKGKALPSLKAKNFACRFVAQTVAKFGWRKNASENPAGYCKNNFAAHAAFDQWLCWEICSCRVR